MKRSLATILMLLVVLFCVNLAASTATLPRNYDLSTAIQLSRLLDRQLIFTFVSLNCSYCNLFKEEIVSAPEVRKFINDHYVFSLVSFDSSSMIKLPEKGEVSNYQLASSLGVNGTPTTFIFYPPDPGLSGRGIIGLPGVLDCKYVPQYTDQMNEFLRLPDYCDSASQEGNKEKRVGIMSWALKRVALRGPGDEEEGDTYYNYRRQKKDITRKDFEFLKEHSVDIPVLSGLQDARDLQGQKEAIVVTESNQDGVKVADQILSSTDLRKVYVVKPAEDSDNSG